MNEYSIESDQFADYRQALIGRFGAAAYRSWFSDISIKKEADDEVACLTSTHLRCDTLRQRYQPFMQEAWSRLYGPARKFSIGLRARQAAGANAQKIGAMAGEASSLQAVDVRSPVQRAKASDSNKVLDEMLSPLDGNTNFENFAVHDTNRMAHAAARQILVEGSAYSLGYIYGASGVGKTHLLHAIGHEWKARYGDGDCAYLTHSGFADGCVAACLNNAVTSLQKGLLSHGLLLIDDVHLLKGKKRTQEELLNLIKASVTRGVKLVVAGEAAPRLLAEGGVLPRLTDHLAGGLAVPIEKADSTLRCQVLRNALAQEKMVCRFDEAAIQFVAEYFHHSMREAIGALRQLMLVYGEQDITIDANAAREGLRAHLMTATRRGTLTDALQAAADAFGVTVDDLKGRAQPQRIARGRHAFVFVSRQYLKEPYTQIAKILGRDHTTAISSFRRAEALFEREKMFQNAVEQMRIAVGG